jgi:Protein of unknown function (DUF2716)
VDADILAAFGFLAVALPDVADLQLNLKVPRSLSTLVRLRDGIRGGCHRSGLGGWLGSRRGRSSKLVTSMDGLIGTFNPHLRRPDRLHPARLQPADPRMAAHQLPAAPRPAAHRHFLPEALTRNLPPGWPRSPYPNGDYPVMISEDLHYGSFGHPWEHTLCLFGTDLLDAIADEITHTLPILRRGGQPATPN